MFSWFEISVCCAELVSSCVNISGGGKVNLIWQCTIELLSPFLLDNGFPTRVVYIHFHPAFVLFTHFS